MRYPHLFEPLQIGPLLAKNRIMMTPHAGNLLYFEARAAGGAGLMCAQGGGEGVKDYSPAPGNPDLASNNDVDRVVPDPTTPKGIAYFDSTAIPTLRAFAEVGHRYGAIVVSQVYHLGSQGFGYMFPAISPSAVRDEQDGVVPHALSEDEIGALVIAWGHAARRCREAGIDAAELHAAHGYLINQFLSPYTNKRTDKYGGSFENRLRFVREIIYSIDREAGPDYPLGLRINGSEMVQGGLGTEEIIAIINALSQRLVYVSVSGGNSTGLKGGVKLAYASPWLVPPGHNVAFASQIREAVSLPVIVAGRIFDPDQAEQLIADGSCDAIGMARGFIADPEWANKARDGRVTDIRPCIGDNECHAFHDGRGTMTCTVNPAATREVELAPSLAPRSRRVLVVGGGPAGAEAARVAAERGHDVVLCEKEALLGGQARIMSLDPNQPLLTGWLEYQGRQLNAAGVEVRRSTEVDAAFVRSLEPDVVILATGARPKVPAIPGVDAPNVHSGESVLLHARSLGRRILVIGGLEEHLRPLTLADLLSGRGHDVTLVSENVSIGRGVETRTLNQILKRLLVSGVTLAPMTSVTSIDGRTVQTRNVFSERTGTIDEIDDVVLAVGGEAVDELGTTLARVAPEVHLIGDCLSPRRLIHAVLEGARVGSVV